MADEQALGASDEVGHAHLLMPANAESARWSDRVPFIKFEAMELP